MVLSTASTVHELCGQDYFALQVFACGGREEGGLLRTWHRQHPQEKLWDEAPRLSTSGDSTLHQHITLWWCLLCGEMVGTENTEIRDENEILHRNRQKHWPWPGEVSPGRSTLFISNKRAWRKHQTNSLISLQCSHCRYL